MKFVNLRFFIGLCFFVILTGCSKNDGPDYGNDITDGPNEFLSESVFRVDNILYEITGENSCAIISGYEDPDMNYYRSNLPYPIFDIPDKVRINGKEYIVETVRIGYGALHTDEITYLTIPSSVLSVEALYIHPTTLIVGANVRSISSISATKVFWLPNTTPSGYRNATYKIAYASGGSYEGNVKYYPQLSSMFSVDGLIYIMSSPSERTCVLVDSKGPIKSNINIDGSVTKDNIKFSITDVNEYTFYNNLDLHNIKIANVNSIGREAFKGCANLSSLQLENINIISISAFENCAIGRIDIPGTVQHIGKSAFKGCKSLKELNFLDGNSTIYLIPDDMNFGIEDSFSIFSDTSIEKLYIGRDLDYISDSNSPFYRMDTLKEVEIHKGETEISNNMFFGCIALNSVIIGDDITTIGKRAFSGCSAMTSFKFGKQLKSIGQDAFSDCTALVSFTSEAIEPPTCGDQALDDINKWNCTLYVPNESIDLYKKAPQWKEFLKIE